MSKSNKGTKRNKGNKKNEGQMMHLKEERKVNWFAWILLAVAMLISCIYVAYCWNLGTADIYAEKAERRQRTLYEQAAKIGEKFEHVYSIRNAKIQNTEQFTKIVLDSGEYQLEITMNLDRSAIQSQVEIQKFDVKKPICFFFLMMSVSIASFSAGDKSRAKYEAYKRNRFKQMESNHSKKKEQKKKQEQPNHLQNNQPTEPVLSTMQNHVGQSMKSAQQNHQPTSTPMLSIIGDKKK